MPRFLPYDTQRVVALDEYFDYVNRNVDLYDLDSIADSAFMLAGVANDRKLIVDRLNARVRDALEFRASESSAQVVFLGRGNGFYLRANIWPSESDLAHDRLFKDQFAYDLAHDHNYNFITINYHGPGYITELFEYDYRKIEGYLGEVVDLEERGVVHFKDGAAMLYRASDDVHIQRPPTALSITLNLMIELPEVSARDQHLFDVKTKTIVGYPQAHEGSRRVDLLRMAREIGNEDTRGLLADLAGKHPCRRTRLMAFESASMLAPLSEVEAIWERACDDPAPLVSNAARERLKALSN